MAFVLDNSVAVAWVPALWQLEIANVVRTACLRHNLALEQARNIFNALNKLPIQIDKSEGAPARQLFELAMRYQISSYDAAYLELAMRLGLDLATQDQALKDAALAAQVSLAS